MNVNQRLAIYLIVGAIVATLMIKSVDLSLPEILSVIYSVVATFTIATIIHIRHLLNLKTRRIASRIYKQLSPDTKEKTSITAIHIILLGIKNLNKKGVEINTILNNIDQYLDELSGISINELDTDVIKEVINITLKDRLSN